MPGRITEDAIHVDSGMLADWLTCREFFRLRWLENLRPNKPSIPMAVGHAFHAGVEIFWNGGSYKEAMTAATKELYGMDESKLNPYDLEKLNAGRDGMPDMLACYFENAKYLAGVAVEVEWAHEYIIGEDCPAVILCGRIDRIQDGPHVFDCKTASAVGKNWLADYKSAALRNPQFGLYDWYLCQLGEEHEPVMTTIEVITKPYKATKPKFHSIDLPELPASRQRFAAQLDWNLREMAHYIQRYKGVRPWPMAGDKTCVGKYGPCEMLEGCNFGWSEKVLSRYKQREEHLTIIGEK